LPFLSSQYRAMESAIGEELRARYLAAGTNLFSYWNADKLVLSMHSAQEIDEHSAPELVAIVRELAQRAGLPMPRVYLMDSPFVITTP
jgi:heat shock protein HtpX